MEVEYGRKIDIALETLLGHIIKLEKHDELFEEDRKIIDMQDCKIYEIEQKIKN